MSMHFFIEFVNKATGLKLYIPKRKVKNNVCSNWQFAQIWGDFNYLGIWQCGRYFVATLFKRVSFNYHQRNVRSPVSVSNFQVSVSAFMTESRSRLEI